MNYLKILFYGKTYKHKSIVGRKLRGTMFVLAISIIVIFLIVFFLDVKRLMVKNSVERLTQIATATGGLVTTVVGHTIDINTSIAKCMALSKSDSMHISYSRDNLKNMMKVGLSESPSTILSGVYWDWNAFDHRDESLADDPSYAKYYGRMCYFWAREKGQIVPETTYEFDESYLKAIKKTKETTVFPPAEMIIMGNKTTVLPIFVPIVDRGTVYGCVFSLMTLDFATGISMGTKDSVFAQCNTMIAADDFTIVAATQSPAIVGRNISEVFGEKGSHTELLKGNARFNSAKVGDTFFITAKAKVASTNQNWVVIAYAKHAIFTEGILDRLGVVITICTILLALTLLTGYVTGFLIGEPIDGMLAGCKQLSKGNLNIKFNLGHFHMKTEISELVELLNTTVRTIRKIVSEVKQSSLNMNGAGKELARSASLMASGSNEQASASEQVASAMEDMTSSIHKNAQNAQQTEDITNEVVNSVMTANQSVRETVEAMRTITDKIGIINEIAGRTDLLAVNAAIEAARVGDLGKGFAVVASEIRKLAEKSQNAAKEIDELTSSGVKQAEASGQLLDNLVPEINRTSELIHEITASSVEQNNNAMQVNNALQQLNSITQQNAATAEELSTSADESQSQAESLDETISFFRVEDETESQIATLNRKAADILKHIDELRNTKE